MEGSERDARGPQRWGPQSDRHERTEARPLEGEGLTRRIAPFVGVGVITLTAAPFVASDENSSALWIAAGFVALLVASAYLLPWARLRAGWQVVPPLLGFVVVALMRDATGGQESVFTAVAFLPVVWLTLYGTRNQVLMASGALALAIAIPAIVDPGSKYPTTEILRGGLVGLVAATLGVAGSQLLLTMRHSQRALHEANERFRRAFDDAAIGMALVDPEGSWLRANRALGEITGYSQDELAGMRFHDITHPKDLAKDLRALDEMVSGARERFQTEKRYHHADGHVVWINLNVTAVRDSDGQLMYMIAQMQDITERREAEARLAHQASHDGLTGLPNRTLLEDRMTLALGRQRRDGRPLSILFLDLDRLKLVNDTRGHEAGDRLLIEVAKRLSGLVRPSDTVSRLGGDEFAILCDRMDEAAAAALAERIGAVLAEPIDVDGSKISTTASIGIAVGRDAATPGGLLADADLAMYEAKEQGRNRYAFFGEDLRERAERRLAIGTG